MTYKYKNLTAVVSERFSRCVVWIYKGDSLMFRVLWKTKPSEKEVIEYLEMYHKALTTEVHS